MAGGKQLDEDQGHPLGRNTPAFDDTQVMSPGTPDPFDSPVDRRLVLERLNAKLFGNDAETDSPDGNVIAPVIGRFSVLRKLGQGGMGTVYLGYDEHLGRKAAIKVMRGHRGSIPARGRMLREAKALARLSHPNVVPIYESGEHDDDLFIAMEFVEGQTLGEWLAGEHTRDEILEVFIAAGRGLAAAHEAKLIHRDFKPDNVMVGNEGQVKVMDFGLARRAGRRPDPDSPSPHKLELQSWVSPTLTETGALMGTPAYMAPEQLVGELTDPRGDQFSYSVALWEALYGVRPFSGDTLITLRNNVLSGRLHEPPRNNDVPAWLRAILDRGLAIDPEQRWPSMAALIEALGKRPQQRWRGVALLGVGVALVAGLGWGAARLSPPEVAICMGMDRELTEVWNPERRAQISAAISATQLSYAKETLSRVETGLDSYGQAWVDARHQACEATARGAQSGGLLDRRMACLDERLREFSALVEVFARADVAVVRKAVAAHEALPSVERCTNDELLAAAYTLPEDPELVRELESLDLRLARASAQHRLGRYDQAAELFAGIAADRKTLGLHYPPFMIRLQRMLGETATKRADYDAAELHFVESYRLAVAAGLTKSATEAALRLVSLFASVEGKNDEARAWIVHAEPLAEAAASPEISFRLAGALGIAATSEGRYEDALAHHQRQLDLLEHNQLTSQLDHAAAHTNIGIVSAKLSRIDEARAHFEQALAIGEQQLGPNHPEVAGWLDNLGNTLKNLGEYDASIARFERALAIREHALGPDHPEVGNSLSNMALSYTNSGRPEIARPLQERARDLYQTAFGPNHPRVAIAESNLGITLSELGEDAEALECYERALAIKREVHGPEHPSVIYTLNGMAASQLSLGQIDAARMTYTEALELGEAKFGSKHLLVALSLTGLGAVARNERDYDLALAHNKRALEIAESIVGLDHPKNAEIVFSLGGIEMLRANAVQALPHFERALRLREAGLEPTDLDLHYAKIALAAAWVRLGRSDEAVAALEPALEFAKTQDAEPLFLAHAQIALLHALRGLATVNIPRTLELEQSLQATRAKLSESQTLVLDNFAAWF